MTTPTTTTAATIQTSRPSLSSPAAAGAGPVLIRITVAIGPPRGATRRGPRPAETQCGALVTCARAHARAKLVPPAGRDAKNALPPAGSAGRLTRAPCPPFGGTMSINSRRRIAAVAVPVALSSIAAVVGAGTSAADAPATAARTQNTKLVSRSVTGGVPNGPSTNGVISNDRRWARVIAFQSDASDIVRGDSNGQTDVFAVKRAGHVNNKGTRWRPGKTILLSRGRGGRPANGSSFSPAVDGAFKVKPKCVAFLSSASNLAGRDTNGR